jgi:hypothetical protein
MAIAELVLKYIEALIWPVIAVIFLILYRDPILALLEKSKVTLSLFGISIETTLSQIESSLMAPLGGMLTPRQWELLEEIKEHGSISVKSKGFVMLMQGDLPWIRPIRNAGLIMTLPDGKYIEQADEIVLTSLGELLMQAKQKR